MVTLSGGDLGGQEVDGTGWLIDAEQSFGAYRYKRVSETQAVYVGMS